MTLDGRVRGLETLETPRFSGARVYNSAALSIPHNTTTNLTFDSERFDTDAYHNTVSGTGRLTAPIAGVYLIVGHVRFEANVTGFRQVGINLNGTTNLAVLTLPAVGAAVPNIMTAETVYELIAGDYVTLQVLQNSGGSLDVGANAVYSPEFMIVLLG